MNFKFELTKEQVRPMLEPVFQRIYQLTDGDLALLNRWINTEKGDLFFDHSYQLKSDLVIRRKSFNPPSDVWTIEFKINPQQTIVGMLPNTVIASSASDITYTPRQNAIHKELEDRLYEFKCHYDGMEKVRMFQPFPISKDELGDAIVRLAREEVLSKYYRVFDDVYLVVYNGAPLFLDVSDGYMNTVDIGELVFDIDDGFINGKSKLVLNQLNKVFNNWKNDGQITSPVIADNVI